MSTEAASYPGGRLGLPPRGPGAVAGWVRRFAAIAVDWLASLLVASVVLGTPVWTATGTAEAWLPLLVFFVEGSALTPLTGGSFGQLVLRLAVVNVNGRPVGLLPSVARTLLICLVFPPLIYNRDQRGLHDLLAGTVTVRR